MKRSSAEDYPPSKKQKMSKLMFSSRHSTRLAPMCKPLTILGSISRRPLLLNSNCRQSLPIAKATITLPKHIFKTTNDKLKPKDSIVCSTNNVSKSFSTTSSRGKILIQNENNPTSDEFKSTSHFPCSKKADLDPIFINYRTINRPTREYQREWTNTLQKTQAELNANDEQKVSGAWDTIHNATFNRMIQPTTGTYAIRVKTDREFKVNCVLCICNLYIY